MKTLLVITSYRHEGQIETLYRTYLPNAEDSAAEQAAEWFSDHCTADDNTEIHHTPQEITPALLRECYPAREDLILAVARLYALDAISEGSPAIPEGTLFKDWSREVDLDLSEVSEWIDGGLTASEKITFFQAYKAELFSESPVSDKILTADEIAKIEEKGAEDGTEDAECVRDEQGIDTLRATQAPGHEAWDSGARNAGVFEIVLPLYKGHQAALDIYYAAYAKAGAARAAEIIAEEDASQE